MRPATEQVTQRVDAVGGGGSQAAEKLLPIVYEELRQMAASKMAKEAPGHTLQPTALVHEAWLRLVGVKGRECWDRAHSLAAAGEARQRMLVENARCQRRAMPHRGQVRLDINQVQVGVASDDETVLAVSETLGKLASRKPLNAEPIRFRFMQVSPSLMSLKGSACPSGPPAPPWTHVRALLYEELKRTF